MPINTDTYPEIVKTFLEIVQIDNPSKQEDELILWLVDKLTSLGVQSITQDYIGNVIATIESNIENNDNYIMFIVHLDSVYPCQGIIPKIEEIDGDHIITSSSKTILSADDKAGISAVIEAVKFIKEKKIEHPNIELVFTVQEEIGLRGAKALEFSQFKSTMAYSIDAEAPVGTIITQGPSQKQFIVNFYGKSAHAGMSPEKGLSSIMLASEYLNTITVGRIDLSTTSNIGLISGGSANNVVPEHTSIKGEARSLYETKLDGIIGTYKMDAEKITDKYPLARYTFEDIFVYHSFYIDTNHEVVNIAMKACDSIGVKPTIKAIGSGSDANIFNYNNIDTVILGTGFKKSHSLDESITFSQLQILYKLIVNIIKESI